MKTSNETDKLARQAVAEELRQALMRGELMSDELMRGIRARYEAMLARAKPESAEALLAQRVIEMAEYVRIGSPLSPVDPAAPAP